MGRQGTNEKAPPAFSIFLLRISEISHLYGYAKHFYQEYAAEYGYQPFLTDDDGEGCDDPAEGKAARISHEYLRRIGVVPKKAHAAADEGAYEDGQLTQIRIL